MFMRSALALPLLLLAAACNVDNDAGNDSVRIDYDQERIENGAAAAARTARDVGSGVGNVAASAGRAIKNEVGDIDVASAAPLGGRPPAIAAADHRADQRPDERHGNGNHGADGGGDGGTLGDWIHGFAPPEAVLLT
jgi:hypothetical protein